MKKTLFFLCLLLISFPAFADCYTPLEAEAEQGIRIHSELMVISLNCQHMTPKGEENLYSQYRKFTAKNASIFATYEMLLIKHFRQQGSGDPERQMHSLRTRYANKISKDAATMRPDAFCQAYIPRIRKASSMNQSDLHKWASTFFPGFGPSKPLCKK